LASTIIKNGDFLSGGRVAPEPLDALLSMQESFGTTLNAIETAGNQVTALATDVQRLLGGGDGELKKIAQKADATIDNFNETLDAIESLFEDPKIRSAIDTVAARLPDLVDDAQSALKQADNMLESFAGVGRATEETMKNVNEFTAPFGREGERIVGDAVRTLNNLDALLTDLRQVSARVTNSEGTIAKLLDDDQLYYTIVNTLQNVETLSRRLQPIVEDARVIADKGARDPASFIDLKGALMGRPRGGIK
jgi:phospholipid/cholesterol/gamma-HCH transport system substrate-binding protein